MVNFRDAVILGDSGALSVKHERIAEIIRDLDPNLELCYIPQEARSVFDKHPFGVRHKQGGYMVFTCAENEVDERLIARLIQGDTRRGNVLGELEAQEAALRLVQFKERMEQQEEVRDFAQSVLKSPKNWYRHNGVVYT